MAGPAVAACAGFLLAVLWMDLMFDSQVRRSGPVLDEPALASIAGYYHRVTTSSRRMLIAAVMAMLLGLLALDALTGRSPGWLLALSAVLAGGPILLATLGTVPRAARLGWRRGTPVEQTRLARAIYRDHMVCLICMLVFLALWLAVALGWAK